MRTRAQLSTGAILAALKPPERTEPEYVGWFVPNNQALTDTFRNVVKAGKRVGVTTMKNGTVKFYAEDPEVPTYEYECPKCNWRQRHLKRIEERNDAPRCGHNNCGEHMVLIIGSAPAGIVKNPAVPRSKP